MTDPEFKRRTTKFRKTRAGLVKGLPAVRSLSVLTGLGSSCVGWFLHSRGFPTPLVHGVHFGNIFNFVGMAVQNKLKMPPGKEEELREWVKDSLDRINDGELLQYTEIDGDEPLFDLSLAKDSNFDLDDPKSVVFVDVHFHDTLVNEISEDDLEIVRMQMIETFFVLALIDEQTPEFTIKVRRNDGERAYGVHEFSEFLLGEIDTIHFLQHQIEKARSGKTPRRLFGHQPLTIIDSTGRQFHAAPGQPVRSQATSSTQTFQN